MGSVRPKVTIIVLNWNGWRDTVECLESLQRVEYPDLKVIVVDNASSDESVAEILNWCERAGVPCQKVIQDGSNSMDQGDVVGRHTDHGIAGVLLLAVDENLGFCAGNNLGMKQAATSGADFLLILNNDTIVDRDFLRPMVEVALGEANIGLVGGVICYAEEPDTIWFAGGRFDKYLEASRVLYRHRLSEIDSSKEFLDTDWVSGCLMLIPRTVFEDLGGFDERFFIWSEEWDYSLRVRAAGYKLGVATKARVFHKVGRSLGVMKPLSYYYGTRNRLLLKRIHLSARRRIIFLAWFLPSRVARFAQFALGGRWDLVRAGWAGIWDYFQGRTGKWQRQSA